MNQTWRRIKRAAARPFGFTTATALLTYGLLLPRDQAWTAFVLYFFTAGFAGMLLEILDAPTLDPPQG